MFEIRKELLVVEIQLPAASSANCDFCISIEVAPCDLYALASSFSSALPLRNHGRSRLCMYRGTVRFFASSFWNHSRASSRRFAIFRKLAYLQSVSGAVELPI